VHYSTANIAKLLLVMLVDILTQIHIIPLLDGVG